MILAGQGATSALHTALGRWDRRLRTAQSLTWGARGLAGGLLVAILVAIASRFWPLLSVSQTLRLAGLGALGGSLIALLLVWLWPRSGLAQARYFDRLLRLQERVSTALEIEEGLITAPREMVERQRRDAVEASKRADPVAAIPLRPQPRDWLPAAVAALALATALWLPNPMEAILAERAAVREEIEEQVEELEALRDEIAADPQLSEEDQQALLEILEGAIEELESGDLSREEALAELTDTSERLKELMDPEAENRAAGLQAAADGLGQSPLTNPLSEALQEGDIQGAAEQLEALAGELENMSAEQVAELVAQLSAAAAALAESNPELAGQLAEAAQALQDGEMAAAAQALEQASGTMGATGQAAAASSAAGNAAAAATEGGQQIAQAGQGAQSGVGGSDNGSGQAGQGAGQDGGDGQGGGTGRGEGNSEGQGGVGGPMEGDNGPGDGGLRDFEPIYAPQRLGGEGGPEMELPQSDEPGELIRELASNPEIGESTVPYNQVYANYVDAANQALQEQQIPLGLRGYVRDYFSSLEP
jgi:hypothetical protein